MAAAKKRLVKLPRDYLIIIMEVGYVLLAMRRFEEAIELFDGVSVLAPFSEVPLIGLGNGYSAQQKFDQAIKEYRKAIKIEPKSALAYAHLGEVNLLKEKKEKGISFLNKAIELDADGKAGNFARALLEAVEKGLLPFSELLKNQEIPPPPTPEIQEKD